MCSMIGTQEDTMALIHSLKWAGPVANKAERLVKPNAKDCLKVNQYSDPLLKEVAKTRPNALIR